MNLKRR